MLAQRNRQVLVIEKEHFPRFSIGESMLPQLMEYLEDGGLAQTVKDNSDKLGFQFKNGAAFEKDGIFTEFDFTDKFTPGPGTTFQVKRADFDQLLATGAEQFGAEIHYGHQVTEIDVSEAKKRLTVKTETGEVYQVNCNFILDASGFGRVLPRLLGLDKVSPHPTRQAIFTHIEDHISAPHFDRNKILITVHPQHQDIWYWLIPFADGTTSLGVVGKPEQLAVDHNNPLDTLKKQVDQVPNLRHVLSDAEYKKPARILTGYSASVSKMHGDGFALLGNAGEFLDPVFSSGVTIALHSSWLISPLVNRFLDGEDVDFEAEFAAPLQQGIDCFRTFVKAWYTGEFQSVIFSQEQDPKIRRMISSILAGYAWDTKNPYVAQSERRLQVLVKLCQEQA
jgi:flavin-dependent dehydrogenase